MMLGGQGGEERILRRDAPSAVQIDKVGTGPAFEVADRDVTGLDSLQFHVSPSPYA